MLQVGREDCGRQLAGESDQAGARLCVGDFKDARDLLPLCRRKLVQAHKHARKKGNDAACQWNFCVQMRAFFEAEGVREKD